MKKLILALLMLGLFLPAQVDAKTAFIGATGLKGGIAGALDAVECEDIRGDDSNRAVATGDVAVILTSARDIYFYRYLSTGTDSEDDFGTDDPIVPDDRSDCSNQGQWELFDTINLARSTNPMTIWRDRDATDSDDNVYWSINCTDTSSGSEDCDAFLYVQVGGTATAMFSIDCDVSGNCNIDINPQGNGTLEVNNSEIKSTASTEIIFSMSISNPSDTDHDDIKEKTPRDLTIENVYADCTGGTSVVVNCKEVDSDADDVDAVTIDSNWTVTCGTQYSDSSFSNPSLNANDWFQCDVGTVTGSVTNFSLTVWGTEE
jgi:hypothetical protein